MKVVAVENNFSVQQSAQAAAVDISSSSTFSLIKKWF